MDYNFAETIYSRKGAAKMKASKARRDFLRASGGVGVGLILNACGGKSASSEQTTNQAAAKEEKKEQEVTATEDLMREHGVLRRALL
ncbi:MAG TPA: hypothetical protein VEV81_07220, partial [Pyrinomonadaceae bacterium]|nr:hypothetical protein [Pyrinomonadaceae bacterium]